jgi:hypothetical protein
VRKVLIAAVAAVVTGGGTAVRAGVIDDLQVGQKAYWSFNDVGGTTVADQSPGATKHNLTLTNAAGGSLPTYNPAGKFGGAVDFNRSGATAQLANLAFANVANTADLHPAGSSAVSMSVWVNFAAIPASGSTYSIYDSTSDAAIIYADGTAGQLRFKVAGTTTSNLIRLGIPLSNFAPNTWYHLVGTYAYNGTASDMHFYLDNDESKTISGGIGGTMTTLGTQTPTVANGGPTGTSYLPGTVDDLAVWNRVLTADERTYLQTNPVPEPASLSAAAAAGALLLLRRRRRRSATTVPPCRTSLARSANMA